MRRALTATILTAAALALTTALPAMPVRAFPASPAFPAPSALSSSAAHSASSAPSTSAAHSSSAALSASSAPSTSAAHSASSAFSVGAEPGPGVAEAARLRSAWRAEPGSSTIGSSPTYAHGSVYYTEDAYPVAGSRTAERITRRDAASGKRLPFAADPVETLFLTRPLSDGRAVFTLSAYEHARAQATIRAYSWDGRDVWHQDLPGEKFPTELVLAGRLILAAAETGCELPGNTGCAHTTVTARSAATGALAWQRTFAGGSPKLAAAAGRVAIHVLPPAGTPAAGTLHTLSTATGSRLWSRSQVPDGVLATDSANVYIAAGRLHAYRAAGGQPRFGTPEARYTTVTATPQGVYAATAARRVTALSPTGRVRWSTTAAPTGPLTASNGVLWFQHHPGGDTTPTYLAALDTTTGKRLRTLPLADTYSTGAIAAGAGHVFATAYLTQVRAYAPRPLTPN